MTETQYPRDYPHEYITGTVTFFGREFLVTPDVLIPRLETEGLVRRARAIQKIEKFEHIVDIGCGSGIIWISLADIAEEVTFLDVSQKALHVAQENFRRQFPEKKAEFIISDLLSNVEKGLNINTLFLANLPYIKKDDWDNMSPDTRHEPELALFGGEVTGFELYEKLFEQLRSNDFEWRMIIEFGFDQRVIAEEIIKKYGWNYEFFPDFAGIERFCEIHLTN